MKVLMIEDDASILTLIQERFAQWMIDVVGVDHFEHVLTQFHHEQPQLVLIDIQLPVFDGFHWCREIRMHSNVPIIFLSSRDHPMDMVMAMQLGADDFIQKPFHMDVLVAKVQALLRRTYDYKEAKTMTEQWCGAHIQYDRAIVTYNEQQIELTKNELFILQVLLEQKGHIVARDDLMRKLWDDERFVNDNTLTVNVNRLRQKLEELGLVDVIVTKKGLGYMAVAQ
ncbi:MAG: response regulator transcription factor [Caryophanon sp.]|nr:response regulator transcription factor [Caryophanon sp.]